MVDSATAVSVGVFLPHAFQGMEKPLFLLARRVAKPNHNLRGVSKNELHTFDLFIPLLEIALVDTGCIGPDIMLVIPAVLRNGTQEFTQVIADLAPTSMWPEDWDVPQTYDIATYL